MKQRQRQGKINLKRNTSGKEDKRLQIKCRELEKEITYIFQAGDVLRSFTPVLSDLTSLLPHPWLNFPFWFVTPQLAAEGATWSWPSAFLRAVPSAWKDPSFGPVSQQ